MALIRCSKCGSLASSRSTTCPTCGAAINSPEDVTTQPTVSEAAAENKPRTLNDIMRERSAQHTIGDSYIKEEGDTPTITPQPKVEPTESVKTPVDDGANVGERTPNPHNDNDYDGYDDNRIDDYEAEIVRHKRTATGFMIAAIVLLLLLAPAAYFSISLGMQKKTIEENYEIVESARKIFEDENAMLQRSAEDLVTELEGLKDQNDTMMLKYQEAVVMLEQLQREKTYNYEQLAKYKREVATLREVMKGYLRQIDSLNTINSNLQAQNVAYKKEISTAQLRADVAEEKADELNTKVRIGSVIQASGIRVVALNAKSKEVKRIKQAERLRVDFDLTANELAEPGEKTIYICITGPDGYLLGSGTVFNFEGDAMEASAMRKVDYENESVPVSIFYDGGSFQKGTYTVDIYIDGRHSGSKEAYFE